MDEGLTIQLISFSTPIFSAMTCMFMCFMYFYKTKDVIQRKLSALLGTAFIFAFLCWTGAVLYTANYKSFVYFNPLFFLALMLDQVLLYYFVYTITKTRNRREFRKIHLIIPIVITLAIGIWSSLIPFDIRYRLVESKNILNNEYPLFSLFFSSSMFVFCVYNILYSILGFRRAKEYRLEIINYSADTERTSVEWIRQFIILILINIPIPLATIFFQRDAVISSPFLFLGAILPLTQYVIICYNLLSGHYLIIEVSSQDENNTKIRPKIDRKKFEKYLRDKKPYLDPKLKITDMCSDLGTNRTYLSTFINGEYGMNFSRFINRLRLNELELLRNNPFHAHDSSMELILIAGFSSYQGYLRAKKAEDEASTMSIS